MHNDHILPGKNPILSVNSAAVNSVDADIVAVGCDYVLMYQKKAVLNSFSIADKDVNSFRLPYSTLITMRRFLICSFNECSSNE